jgi:hypothetical protein
VKPRHAAALSLVGWYLMLPPLADRAYDLSQPRLIEGDAPLSEWIIKRAYDTAEECVKAQKALHDDSYPIESKYVNSNHEDADSTERIKTIDIVQNLQAECIETDDPRLNGN